MAISWGASARLLMVLALLSAKPSTSPGAPPGMPVALPQPNTPIPGKCRKAKSTSTIQGGMTLS